jgi:outer membrane receptor protein involved in Fe transport
VTLNVLSGSHDGSTATANTGQNYTSIKTFTQEIRLAGEGLHGRLQYLFGGYYADERIRQQISQTLGGDHQAYISAILTSLGVPGVNPARGVFAGGVSSEGSTATNLFRQSARNGSAFGNLTYVLTDQVKINLGMRYSDDEKQGRFNQLYAFSPACDAARANVALFPNLPAGDPRRALAAVAPLAASLTCYGATSKANNGPGSPQTFDRRFKDDRLIYTGKLLWSPTDEINGYASLSHGYKSGGFNLDATAAVNGANPAFKSETVDAYEFGLKTRWFDNRLTANFAVFRQDVKNYQLLEFTGSQFTAYNVGGARSDGVEAEATFRTHGRLTLTSAITYLDTSFNDDCDGGAFSAAVSPLCGQRLFNVPDWTIVSGADWWRPVGESLKVALNANVRYESERRVSPQALMEVAAGTGTASIANYPAGVVNNYVTFPNSVQKANAKVNLRATLGALDGRWTLEIWGDNVTDQHTMGTTYRPPFRGVATLPGPYIAGGVGVAVASFVQEPRTYGVTLRARY